jgi:branched-chain amino acid aminotransferase
MSKPAETDWIWRNGELIRWEQATLHVMSHVVHYGSSAFEGIRVYDTPEGPCAFRLHDHVRRLFDSARIYRMPVRFAPEEIAEACAELVRVNELPSGYIRPVMLRGYGTRGVDPSACPVDVYLACWPWGAYLGDDALERGVDVCVSSWTRVAPNTLPAMAKAGGNYLSSQLIKLEAAANGYHEGIALGPDGRVSEGSGENLFLVRDGLLVTPPVDGTMLQGITRHSILTLAAELDIPTREQAIPREALYGADELFLVGTAAEVTPVRSVDRIQVGSGSIGPITRVLQERLLGIAGGRLPDPHGWRTPVWAMAAEAA